MPTYFTVDKDGNLLTLSKSESKDCIKMTENMEYPVDILDNKKTRTIATKDMKPEHKVLKYYNKHEVVFRNGKFKVKGG